MNQPSGRFELLCGEVVAMSPERAGHARVKKHVLNAFDAALAAAGLGCEAFADGMAVRIDESTVYEPDAMIRCGAMVPSATVFLEDPVVVVEVVSPSSSRHRCRREARRLLPAFIGAALPCRRAGCEAGDPPPPGRSRRDLNPRPRGGRDAGARSARDRGQDRQLLRDGLTRPPIGRIPEIVWPLSIRFPYAFHTSQISDLILKSAPSPHRPARMRLSGCIPPPQRLNGPLTMDSTGIRVTLVRGPPVMLKGQWP